MGGSFLQLVAKGGQDLPLTGNPQMTFFKSIYRRHTNFSSESVNVPLEGGIQWGMHTITKLPRKGDLISDIYISVELPKISVTGPYPTVRWVDKLGHAMIEYVELYIGNELIDRHTGEWLELWSQLTLTEERKATYYNMIGHKGSLIAEQIDEINPQMIYIPLTFWFCKNTGLALPIVALQYHDIDIRIKFRNVEELYITSDSSNVVTVEPLKNVSVYVHYYYLDKEERRRFASKGHKYLIEQVQQTSDGIVGSNGSGSFPISFNHPVKELIWVVQRKQSMSKTYFKNAENEYDYNDIFNYTASATAQFKYNMIDEMTIQLNGMDLLSSREAQHFNLYIPYKHHTRSPETGVFVYTFSENPEEYQPSGTCNFSRIDNAHIKFTMNGLGDGDKVMRVYAVNYNILIIQGGQAGLAYTH